MAEYRPKPRDEIARNMSAIRSADNKTEAALRKALHRMGLRYRKYAADLPGRPDIVFPTERVAVFVDGDYWHGRVLREQGMDALRARIKTPQKEYWLNKFQRRVARDDYVTGALEAEGWTVLRFWEGDIKKDVAPAAEKVARTVRERRKRGGTSEEGG
jgi:DNA mismatch endonuclease (patch repair protein)